MSATLGTIRELPAYSEYTRFGPNFRLSPESLSGSRLSTGSSRSKGCWCSYLWMFLLLILIIISLIASNLSIYFLMKDSCDANLARMEQDLVADQKFYDNSNPFKNDDRKGFDLGLYFTTPFLPSSNTRTNDQYKLKTSSKPIFSTAKSTQLQTQTQASAQSSTSTMLTTFHIKVAKTSKLTQNSGDTGGAVAGILQLEATIRIPQEQEAPFPSSLNPLVEDYFDLSKYFSLRPLLQNDTRNRRTTDVDGSKDVNLVPTNSALVGHSVTFNDHRDYLDDTVMDENFPALTNFPGSSTNYGDQDQPNAETLLKAAEVDLQVEQKHFPFRPLSENLKITDNFESNNEFESTSTDTFHTRKPQSFPELSPFPSTTESKSVDDSSDEASIIGDNSQISNIILPSKGYEKSELFNRFENAVVNDDGKYPALFVSGYNKTVDFTEEYIQLPDDLIPSSYIVEWYPHLEPGQRQFSFDGFVLIDFYCQNETNEILLNAKDLLIDQRSLAVIEKNKFANTFPISNVQVNDDNSLILFTLTKPLQVGFNYSFGTRFSGIMSHNSGGLSYLDYTDKDGKKRLLAATQFEVAEARRAFPCFDEPRFKANFTITIIRNKNMTSLSNMKLVQSVPRTDDYVEDHYATSVKMSTYLVAFVISDFHFNESQSKRGVSVRTYSRPDFVFETEHALSTAVKLLDYFEEYFDILYPLDKLDLIALPDFSHGAMENWGLITFKEGTMLYDPKSSLTSQRETVSMIVGHELAHQWFGNLVTMRWWNDLWLNEGFAHYMGFASAEAIYPEEPMEQFYILSNALEALRLDSMTSTHPVLFDVLHPVEIVQLFDTITYKKGSCLVRMMAHFLGADTLRKGLQIYLRDNAYKNTISNDLWTALDQAVNFYPTAKVRMEGLSVTTVMDNWIRLTGHPVVTVTRNYTSGSAVVVQERMRQNLDAKLDKFKDSQLWVIPFTIVTSENLDWSSPKIIWLQNKTTSMDLRLPSTLSWIVGNINFQGFYRVNYDETNWKLLIGQLKVNHLVFPEAQRAQILADAFDFSSSGLLDITMALNATEYLINETEYLPWLVALKNFEYIDIIMQTTIYYDLFKEFMRKELEALYDNLGWEQQLTDNKHTIYLRYHVLDYSCHYENPKCLEKTKFLLQTWMERGNLDNISVDLRPVVKCYGVAQGGTEEVRFVIRELRDLKAPMCSKDKVTLENILSIGLNDSVIWALTELVRAASTTYVGREAARSFIVKYWRTLARTLNEVAGDFAYVFQRSSDVEDRIQLLSLLAAEDVNVAWRKLEEAKEALNANMLWKEKYLDKIVSWIKSRMP